MCDGNLIKHLACVRNGVPQELVHEMQMPPHSCSSHSTELTDQPAIKGCMAWTAAVCDTPIQGLIGLIGYSYQQVATSFPEVGLQRTPRLSVLGPEKFGDG